MKVLIMLLIFSSFIIPDNKNKTKLELPAVFSDNMVLQRNTEAAVWGKSDPGTKIIVLGTWGAEAETTAGDDGLWSVKIKTLEAGGPYDLKIIAGDSAVMFSNVMLGEVWLCSGQSNMEMPLEGWPGNPIKNSAEEIKNADYPDIRLFTVARKVSDEPDFNCKGSWSECNPTTAATFSATAYFFGRRLYKELKVPIGLIHSSWGGTRIQPWISGKFLEQLPDYKSYVDSVVKMRGEIRKLYAWIYSHPVVDVSKKKEAVRWKDLEFGDEECAKTDFDDNKWESMKLPTLWENAEIGTFDGAVWFRKKVEIPASWVGKDLKLNLGPIDDMDRSYVNGTLVGATEVTGYYATPRIYKVPKKLVKGTALTIAVRVVDNQGGGGLWGNGVKMMIHPAEGADTSQSVSLAGDWKFLPSAEYMDGKFYIYNVKDREFNSRPKPGIEVGPDSPTMIFNGMIAPLEPYGIKGAIWYQGESNSNTPKDYNNYHTLFSLMIKNWRSDWHEGDFPFYYVQIAPFNYGETSHSQMVRYAQFQTLSVPNTGMAVTLDIGGDINIIHPPNKQEVGRRLALWAIAKNYGKDVKYSGPLYDKMKVEDGKAILSFKYADDGLVLKKIGGKTNFQIAGTDKKFVDAEVKVDGDKLIVYSDAVKDPAAVRYAWSNTAEGTLFNKEGLPASTFKTDDWGE